MTSKLVVNTIEADTGISSVSFASSISLSSTSVFHLGDAGVNIGADTNISRAGNGILAFNINSSEKVRINSAGKVGINSTSPTYALEVDGGTQNTVIALRSTDAQAAISFLDNTSGGYGRATIGGEGDEVYITSGAGVEALRIGAGGTVTTSYQIVNDTAPDFPFVISQVDPSNTVNQLGGSGVGLIFSPATNSVAEVGAGIAAVKPGDSDGNSTSDLAFYVSQNDETLDEAMRITSKGYREIRNYHYGPWAFVNNTTKTTITVGDPGDNKFTTIKLILTLIDGAYRQGMWQGEYTIFASNSVGGPGVNYYLKEHWQQVGSSNWSGGTVGVSITNSGALQIIADNGHDDANGNAYIHILDVIGDIDGSTVASISS